MTFLKQNWFKISILAVATIATVIYGLQYETSNSGNGDEQSIKDKRYEAYAVGKDNYPILVIPIDEGVTSTDLNDDNIKDIVLKNLKDDSRLSSYIYNFVILEANGDRKLVKVFNKSGKYETDIETSHSDNCITKDINLLDTLDMGKLLVIAERFPNTKSDGQVDFSFYKLSLENGVYVYRYRGHVASEKKYCDVNDGLEEELPQAFETARNINIFEPTPKPTPQLRTKTPTPKPTPDPNAEILKQLKISDLDRAMDVMYENLMGNIKLINSSPSQYCNTLSKYNPDHAYYLFTSFISQMHTKYDADASYIPEMAIKLAALDKYPNQIIQRCYDYGYYPTP